MPHIALRSRSRDHIYSGDHQTVREAVEHAALKGICLDGIDLSNQDLRGVTLDGIALDNALFYGADLSGANLSEASLIGADFTHSRLLDTCFAYSDLSCSRFGDARFGATDISGAVLDDCLFAGPDTFALDFRSAKSLFQTHYIHDDSTSCPMTRPPIVVKGLAAPLALLDRHILAGPLLLSCPDALRRSDLDSVLQGLPLLAAAARHRISPSPYIRHNE